MPMVMGGMMGGMMPPGMQHNMPQNNMPPRPTPPQQGSEVPHNILFLQNLPQETTEMMLTMLFEQ